MDHFATIARYDTITSCICLLGSVLMGNEQQTGKLDGEQNVHTQERHRLMVYVYRRLSELYVLYYRRTGESIGMRVISGSAKGRPLKAVPGNGTRPTTDKVKEAMFSIIGPYFAGGQVLDLFAGTGGLGIEALSRGMEHGVFIDMEYKSIEVIKSNVQSAGLTQQAEIYRNEAGRALKVLQKRGTTFDLVFLDPPYRMKNGILLMQDMHERNLLQPDATVVLEFETGHPYPPECPHFVGVRQAVYGETSIYVYRYEPEAQFDRSANETAAQQGGTIDE